MDFVLGIILGVILTWVWYPTVSSWWRARQLPYRAVCDQCKDGSKFSCMSNDVASTDAMIRKHKELDHHE